MPVVLAFNGFSVSRRRLIWQLHNRFLSRLDFNLTSKPWIGGSQDNLISASYHRIFFAKLCDFSVEIVYFVAMLMIISDESDGG